MLSFIKQFLRNPRQTGAIARFSNASIEKTLSKIDRTKDMTVVELWGWQWFFTKAIAKHLSPNSQLSVFEINKEFSEHLQPIESHQVHIIYDTVLNLAQYSETHFPQGIDVIISTLPLALFSDHDTELLFWSIINHLNHNGDFLQLQYSTIKEELIKKHFPNYTTDRELINIPPTCIFHCKK